MTINALKILAELKNLYPVETSKQDLVANLAEEGITMPAVSGTVNALVKKKLAVERIEEVTVDSKVKVIRYVVLNDAGLKYDPEEEAARKLEEKEAAKEAKAKARAEAKAAKEAKVN